MPTSTPVRAFVALGANLGDRAAAIRAAADMLRATPGVEVGAVSSLLENPAVGGPEDSPPFLNAVTEVRTTLSPHALLDRLMEIERTLGRERRERWAPRTIDLDVILYGERVIDSDDLAIPHPRMHERAFVLKPLAEIAPDTVHPTLQVTAAELLDALERPEGRFP